MKKIIIRPENFFKVLAGTDRSQVAEMVLGPGQSTGGSENMHPESDQWLYVVEGEGKAIIEGRQVKFKTGDLILIEKGETPYFLHWQYPRFKKTKKPMFCLIGEDCAGVIDSKYGTTRGVKNEIIGMWYYGLLLLSLSLSIYFDQILIPFGSLPTLTRTTS